MSFVRSNNLNESNEKFVESLQSDFKTLASEVKKKYPQIKESCEEAVSKLNNVNQQVSPYYAVNQILYPLVQGCETKDIKVIKFCLGMMQRLVTQQVVDQKGARYITDALWMLMENNIEEVKVLQTITLLLTTNSVVRGETLAKSLVLCFRLHFTKDSTIINTAGATIRQLVSVVFERVAMESDFPPIDNDQVFRHLENPPTSKNEHQSCATDAFYLFQDLVQLVNAEQPFWLIGMTEMTRTFGLELLEAILMNFHAIFYQNSEFTSLLKERVCALVIKLFSPNIKHRHTSQNGNPTGVQMDKPYFPISTRLLRLVSVLIQNYHSILVTECEIFLSLITKFLDNDKPIWQRALALEVIHKIATKPKLIAAFCKSYDLKDHATNIFQSMINSLGAFVQNLLVNSQSASSVQSQATTGTSGASSASGILTQQGFMFRGVWFPLIATFSIGKSKATYLEMLEKMEPPTIPEGYCMSLAYAVILEMMNSISLAMELPSVTGDTALKYQLINSSWGGFLAAILPLADAATDEAMMDSILKAMQNYIALCGQLGLLTPRDAFITAICRAALPYHYALNVLNIGYQGTGLRSQTRLSTQDSHGQFIGQCNENDFRQQIVAVGTALPTISSPAGAQHGPVMLTAKNLHCMKALLHLAHCHGGILGTSWHMVLATLQHLVWILGLKPSTGGSLQAAPKTSIDSNVGIQTAVMADLPVLSQMLSQLFESSQYLENSALHHLIDALCKLSQEAMELAYTNREPSLFAVAKLLETGIVNLPRIEVLWRPLTSHLLEVCQHRHIRMREWGVEAITYLVRAALQFKYEVPLKDNVDLQTLLLNPLAELSTVPHGDVRQRQLECVLQILNGAGENLSFGWPSILDIIGAVDEHHGEALIRTAFQCLQLVITDFLQVMPPRCLPLCVNTTAKFGIQTQELNISLTAVGLMWNISDYFNQNQEKLSEVNIDACIFPTFPGTFDISQFDKLWMCLYTKLGELCVDLRPAVRKSASQTLFSTISAHGSLLNPPSWQAVLWQVLFPLLDKVRNISSSASSEKVDTSGTLLIHHSRNTAQKQWAETQVLTLSGVSRVFTTKKEILRQSADFIRAWALLLEFIENAALCRNNEVSLAAMKSFQEIIYDSEKPPSGDLTSHNGEIWNIAWKTWLKIGSESTKPANKVINDSIEEIHIPSQAFLTALVQIFPALFHHVRERFSAEDFDKLCTVLMNAVIIPVHIDIMPYVLSTNSDSLLSPLHDCVLECMELLQKEATHSSSIIKDMVPYIFRQLLHFSRFACIPPVNDSDGASFKTANVLSNNSTVEWITMNYIPFGEKALSVAVKLYQKTATEEVVVKNNVLHEIIKALHLPLSLKYKCLSSSTWKLAIESLLAVLQTGLKVARAEPTYFASIWDDLSDTLDKFLFPASVCAVEDRGLEEIVLDEAIDCQVIELLRDEVLPYSNEIPHKFILNIVVLLNKGSIHSTSDTNINDSDWKLREMFAKICFETLLQFSLLEKPICHGYSKQGDESDFAGRLAVTALLHRFQEVLKRFNDDERQSGKCPLPRYRLSEISFVLKAIATLIISLKKASPNKVNKTTWEQLIALYPYLVDCTTTTSIEVSRSLREALLQYTDLLQAPRSLSYYKNEKSCQC